MSLDGPDPAVLARLYAGLLGVEVDFESESFCAIGLSPHLWLSTQRVARYRPPQWPDGETSQQVHIEFSIEDLDAGEAAAIALAARQADGQPSPDRWRVMLDPAGHPFCLTILNPE